MQEVRGELVACKVVRGEGGAGGMQEVRGGLVACKVVKGEMVACKR